MALGFARLGSTKPSTNRTFTYSIIYCIDEKNMKFPRQKKEHVFFSIGFLSVAACFFAANSIQTDGLMGKILQTEITPSPNPLKKQKSDPIRSSPSTGEASVKVGFDGFLVKQISFFLIFNLDLPGITNASRKCFT